jgi:hypothetical protein
MPRKALYTKKLGNEVAKQAKGGIIVKYHIILSKADRWEVVSKGSVKPIKAFSTKNAALFYLKQCAESKHIEEVIIHEASGSIIEKLSF